MGDGDEWFCADGGGGSRSRSVSSGVPSHYRSAIAGCSWPDLSILMVVQVQVSLWWTTRCDSAIERAQRQRQRRMGSLLHYCNRRLGQKGATDGKQGHTRTVSSAGDWSRLWNGLWGLGFFGSHALSAFSLCSRLSAGGVAIR